MASAVERLIRSTLTRGVEVIGAYNRRRRPAPTTPHPYLSGVHRPMTSELSLVDLPVTGTLPPALDGRYLRIGPNPIAADPAAYHWFAGDGMVHGLHLQDGRALSYRNRWIRSEAVAAALHDTPAPGPRHGGFDTVNTNVVDIAGRTFALVEAGPYPVELSDRLDEQAFNPFDGTLAGSFTAHPHHDPATGEHHAICYEGRAPGVIRHVVVDRHGAVIREEPVAVRHGPSIHDCALTARYVVILDLPVTFSLKAALGGHVFPYRWNPDHVARVGLLPRLGTAADIRWCEVDPAYVFHVANAYDRPDGTVAMDCCAYRTMFTESARGPDSRSRGLERWIIDPATARVRVEALDDSPQEFPRIDERFTGRPHRYVFTLALPASDGEQGIGGTALYRYDGDSRSRATYEFGAHRYPGEFVFVPAHPTSGEGEGWLVGLVIDAQADTTAFVVLDAQRFEAPPVATVHLPHRIPPGFHGNWIAARQST